MFNTLLPVGTLFIALLLPCIASAGVVINGVEISDSGKIIYLDKTEQGSATPQGPQGPKGDPGEQGPQGPKGDPGPVDKTAICQIYADDNLPAPPFCGKKIIFLTSQSFNANLGGLVGADLKCQTAATNAGFVGTFKAWLSDDGTAANARLTHSPAPYIRTDGTIIAESWIDLTDGWLKTPIVCDEFKDCTSYFDESGTYGSNPPICVYTYTRKTGNRDYFNGSPQPNCYNWTTNSCSGIAGGNAANIDYSWTDSTNCGGGRLYCFEQ